MANLKEDSKKTWTSSSTIEHIQIGCLQRIADATEAMAGPYQRMVSERDKYERYYHNQVETNDRLKRRISALQGVITRMKKQSKQ